MIRDNHRRHDDSVIKVLCSKIPWVLIVKEISPNQEAIYVGTCKMKEITVAPT